MFERYTETARRVIVSSKHKAALLGCHEIETDTYCWTCYRKIRLLKLPFLKSRFKVCLFASVGDHRVFVFIVSASLDGGRATTPLPT